MSSRNVETLRAAHEAFNRRDFEAVVNAMAENVTYDDRARNANFRGRAGFKQFMQEWATAFSNAEVSERTYIDGGDVVVAQVTGRGVSDGPLGSLPATGRQMNLACCEVVRFNDKGQIVSGALYYDQLSLLTQLGHASVSQPA